jgi:hypothetical protein
MRLSLFVLIALSTVGCRHTFPRPYTVSQLQEDSPRWPGDALVHYLSQPNADVAVCNVADGVLTRQDEELINPFMTSLEEGGLPVDRWQGCATRLVPSLTPTVREFALGRLARVILSLLRTRS